MTPNVDNTIWSWHKLLALVFLYQHIVNELEFIEKIL